MITKEEMLPILVGSCPSFANKWEEHKREYNDEEGFLPYVALGAFARHLVKLYEERKTGEFEKIFDVIEKLHIEGDAYVKEAATIGLLEGLQNTANENAEKFVPYLKPDTLKWWNELNKFWNAEIRYVGETIDS
jgi:hypothetical protein